MTTLTWQEYFEQFIRVRAQNLDARQASGRELIEQLRAIAADYKRVLSTKSDGRFLLQQARTHGGRLRFRAVSLSEPTGLTSADLRYTRAPLDQRAALVVSLRVVRV
jgi:hypothetical protein